MVFDCRLGPTLYCLVAEKTKLPKYNFSATTKKLFNQVKMGEGEFKKVGLRKELAKFEKQDVEEVVNGR